MKNFFTRAALANLLMVLAILLIGTGISILSLGWGLASAGVACGIFGYLLGAE